MQNDKYTDFDLELKQMLGGAEEEAPSRLWDAVCSELDRRDRRKVVALRWRRAAACVAAAAAVVAGVFIFTGRESAPEPVRTAEVIGDTEVVVEDIPAIEEQIAASGGAALASVPEQAVRRPSAASGVPSAVAPADTFVPEEVFEDEPVQEQVAEAPEEPAEAPSKPVEIRNEPSVTFNPDDPFAWDLEGEPESQPAIKRISFSASGNAMTNDFTGTSVLQMRTSPSGVKARTGVEEKGTSTYAIPLTFGAGVRFNFSDRWSVGTGLNWSMLSSTFNGTYTEVNSDIIRSINSEIDHDIYYIGIPLNAYYNILNNRNLRFYVWGGGSAERAVLNRYRIKSDAGDIFYKESVDGLQYSVAGGLGLEFLIGKHFGLYLDPSARYFFDCGQPSSIRTKHPFMLNYEVGFRFNL